VARTYSGITKDRHNMAEEHMPTPIGIDVRSAEVM